MKAHGILNEEGRILAYLYLQNVTEEQLNKSNTVPPEAYVEIQCRETGIKRQNLNRHFTNHINCGNLIKTRKLVTGDISEKERTIYLLTEQGMKYVENQLLLSTERYFKYVSKDLPLKDTLETHGYNPEDPMQIAKGLYDMGHISNEPRVIKYLPDFRGNTPTEVHEDKNAQIEIYKKTISNLEDTLKFEREMFLKHINVPADESDLENKLQAKFNDFKDMKDLVFNVNNYLRGLRASHKLPSEVIITVKYLKDNKGEAL